MTAAVVCFGIGSALHAAWNLGWTYDEPFHFGWARRLLEERVTERQSTPLFNSKTPILVPNVLSKMAGEALGSRNADLLRFLSRLPTVGWFAATLGVLFWLVRRAAGPLAAHLATMATALDPNWIAHGSLATTDAAYGFATLATLGAGLALAERPSRRHAVLLGAALGLAFLTKFTAFLLIPGLLLVPLARPGPRSTLAAAVRQSPLVVLVAWLLVCGGYFFVRFGEPLSASRWKSSPMKQAAAALPGLRLPLPADFVTGVDMCIAHERGKGWPVMLFGRRHPDGVWYYFVALGLLKTPLGLLLPLGFGLARRLHRGLAAASPMLRLFGLNVLLNGLYFSLLFRAQIGYRYVLMCLPLVYALGASGLAGLRWTSLRSAALLCLLGLALAENTMFLGDPIAFTNLGVWPKRDVYRLMDNSNLAWGQDRMKVRGWLAERGLADSHLDPVHILPGHNTLELNFVTGVGGFEQTRWIRENLRPGGRFGHTYLWYEVRPSDYNRFMNEARRFRPTARDQALCGNATAFEALDPARTPPFGSEAARSVWIACVRTETLVDLGLSVENGLVRLGRAEWPLGDWELIAPAQVAWYRLEPGVHALVTTGGDWRFQGRWHVQGPLPSLEILRGVLGKGDFVELAPSAP